MEEKQQLYICNNALAEFNLARCWVYFPRVWRTVFQMYFLNRSEVRVDGELMLWLRCQSHLDEYVGYRRPSSDPMLLTARHTRRRFSSSRPCVWRGMGVLLLRSVKDARLRLGGHCPRTAAELRRTSYATRHSVTDQDHLCYINSTLTIV